MTVPSADQCASDFVENQDIEEFLACLRLGEPDPEETILVRGDQIEFVLPTGTAFGDSVLTSVSPSGLNELGQILLTGVLDDEDHVVIRDGQIVVRDGDIVDGMRVADVVGLDINNRGDFLFSASTEFVDQDDVDFDEIPTFGLFVNNELVVANGQDLDGKTANWVFGTYLNDAGTVAFTVRYNDFQGESFEVFMGFPTDPPVLSCDFDASGTCDVNDLDSLLAAVGTANPVYDLEKNNTVDLGSFDQ